MTWSKKKSEQVVGSLLIVLSINAILVGYWSSAWSVSVPAASGDVAAMMMEPSDGTAEPSLGSVITFGQTIEPIVFEQAFRVYLERVENPHAEDVGRHQHAAGGAPSFNLSMLLEFEKNNAALPCRLSAAFSDLVRCQDELMPQCRVVSGCPAPEIPVVATDAIVVNRTATKDTDGDVPNPSTAIPSNDEDDGGGGGGDPVSKPAAAIPPTSSSASPHLFLNSGATSALDGGGQSLLVRAMRQAISHPRHHRVHYYCTYRDEVRQWNLTFRILSAFCHLWNETQQTIEDNTTVANVPFRLRPFQRANATYLAEKISTVTRDVVQTREWFSSNCSMWQTHAASWTARGKKSVHLKNSRGALRFFSDNVTVENVASVLSGGVEEWLAFQHADAIAPPTSDIGATDSTSSPVAASVDDPYADGPWTHEAVMWGWFHRSVLTEVKTAAIEREAYAHFRAELKRRREREENATAAITNSSNGSDSGANATTVAPTPVPVDMEDMLRADPKLHEGCDSKRFLEVRVAFVGDSLSVQYPRRIVQWMRTLCSCCVNATVKVHLYNFAASARRVVDGGGYRDTVMYTKSLMYEPDIVVLMLGTNDATRYEALNETLFGDTFEAIVRSYLDLPTRPHVILLTPPPVFDSVMVNVTRKANRYHRAKTYRRRVAYADEATSFFMGAVVVPAIKRVGLKLQSQYANGKEGGGRVTLVDLNKRMLHWLLRYAANLALIKAKKNSSEAMKLLLTEKSLSAMPTVPPAEQRQTYAGRGGATLSEHYLYGVPLQSTEVQRAIFHAMTDGLHLEKLSQKIVAAEVLRQLLKEPGDVL